MKAKSKDIEYYMGLNYDIVVRKINDDSGSFYHASTKELDPYAFYGVGNTIEEAIQSLDEAKRVLFEDHLENGLTIPEPELIEDELYSGKFVIRTTPRIHRMLARGAKSNKLSLNSFANEIFNIYFTSDSILGFAKQAIEAVRDSQTERSGFGNRVYELPTPWIKGAEGDERNYNKSVG